MFSYISQHGRGRPLVNHEVIVSLMAATVTKTGLAIQSEVDETHYPTGTKVTDEQMDRLSIRRTGFHGEWNYTLIPSH